MFKYITVHIYISVYILDVKNGIDCIIFQNIEKYLLLSFSYQFINLFFMKIEWIELENVYFNVELWSPSFCLNSIRVFIAIVNSDLLSNYLNN